jgi:quinol-cytochrome oxidoreductase complex cytochrome b subunit
MQESIVDTFAFAIPGPATVFLLMAQGIFENKLFYLIHWLVMPLVAVGMVVFAFYLTRKIHNSKKP